MVVPVMVVYEPVEVKVDVVRFRPANKAETAGYKPLLFEVFREAVGLGDAGANGVSGGDERGSCALLVEDPDKIAVA